MMLFFFNGAKDAERGVLAKECECNLHFANTSAKSLYYTF